MNKGRRASQVKKPASSGGPPPEDRFKAIVLADSFSQEFRPITMEKPRSLLPLVNIPLLEYTLEFLAASGIEEILVVCCSHIKQIREYLRTSKRWNNERSDIEVHCIESPHSHSTGDALRDILDRDLIRSDFVLVAGDIVSNMNLAPAIREHKERSKKDKQALMTMVLKTASSFKHQGHATHPDSMCVAIAPDKQLLACVNDQTDLTLQLDKFAQFSSIDLRSDLIDTHIYICSPEVLFLFRDNFDFVDVRDDFVRDFVLLDEELNNKAYTYVIASEYAARVNNLHSYDTVSKDIVHRWVYPIAPDSNFTGQTSYRLARPNNYFENSISLAMSCVVGTDTVIGEGTQIGDNSIVDRTIIGRNVKIGKNVKISGSYLWDNVVVMDGAVISDSLICSGAVISASATLSRGSIISHNVTIGEGFTVAEHTRLTVQSKGGLKASTGSGNAEEDDEEDREDFSEEEDDDNAFGSDNELGSDTEEEYPQVESEVGVGGRGRIYHVPLITKTWNASKSAPQLPPAKLALLRKWNMLGILQRELEYDFDATQSEELVKLIVLRSQALSATNQQAHRGSVPSENSEQRFMRECHDTIRRAIVENHSIDNALLEVNALKFAYDASSNTCAHALATGMLVYSDADAEDSTKLKLTEVIQQFRKILKKWAKLLKNFLTDEDEQVEFLCCFMDWVREGPGAKYMPLLQYIVQLSYEEDICDESNILSWASQMAESSDPVDRKLVKQCDKFITWLREANEEDDDDDDDDDEDDEEDEDDD